MYIIPGKNFNNVSNQKITHAVFAIFFFDFGLILAILRRFFATLRRFKPHNDGNQLPGCRLFPGMIFKKSG